MSERTRTQKYLIALFWGGVCAVFVYFIYTLVAEVNKSEFGHAAPTAPRLSMDNTEEPPAEIVLVRDADMAVGGLTLRYRGMEGDSIVLEYIVMDLDPDYAYRRHIDIEAARQGFRIAGKTFTLLDSVGRNILLLEPGPF